MTGICFRHVLLTMFNRRLGGDRGFFKGIDELDDDWLRYRWQLFTRYTVPSVAAQSESDFSWLILCHPRSPEWLRALTTTVTAKADVHFSFQRQDPVCERLVDGADGLLLTRIDSDDVWHRRAMERIREDCEADPYTSEIVTFTDGYLLDHQARRLRPYYDYSPPFCTKISLGPDLNPLDFGGNHTLVRRRYPSRSISDGQPMFTLVVHRQQQRGRGCDPSDSRWLTSVATAEILDRDFGVTLADGPRGRSARPAGPPGLPGPAGRRRAQPIRRERVVVSVPCLRSWGSVARAVESVLTQTYRDLLVVVTNDGDADPHWEVLGHIDDPRLIRIDHAVNRGRYFVDQTALMARLGRYLLIQDADEWSEPDRVDSLLSQMRRQHSVAAVSCHYQHSSPAVIGPGPVSAPVTALYRNDGYQPSWYHALFDAPSLLSVGGCFGGHRVGYDTFLFHLTRMTGPIAALDQPLYHRHDPSGTAENHSGAAYRDASQAGLARLHGEAYHVYCEYLQGNIDTSLLSRQLRSLAWRHVSASEWSALRDEAHRLRWTARAVVRGR